MRTAPSSKVSCHSNKTWSVKGLAKFCLTRTIKSPTPCAIGSLTVLGVPYPILFRIEDITSSLLRYSPSISDVLTASATISDKIASICIVADNPSNRPLTRPALWLNSKSFSSISVVVYLKLGQSSCCQLYIMSRLNKIIGSNIIKK